jgi:type IV pilus assembly protein PilN
VIRINLIPPEEKPKSARPRFGAVVPALAALFLVLAVAGLHARQVAELQRIQDDLRVARAETARLRPQIETVRTLKQQIQEIDRRLDVIRTLDRGRFQRVSLVDELSRQTPSHVWLTRFTETSPSTIEIDGVTFSNMLVADFISRLEGSDLYEHVDLVVIERGTIEDRDVVRFSLTSSVLSERPERPEGDAGVTIDD